MTHMLPGLHGNSGYYSHLELAKNVATVQSGTHVNAPDMSQIPDVLIPWTF